MVDGMMGWGGGWLGGWGRAVSVKLQSVEELLMQTAGGGALRQEGAMCSGNVKFRSDGTK